MVYKLAATWRRPTFIQVIRVNSCSGIVIYDACINVVLVLLLHEGGIMSRGFCGVQYRVWSRAELLHQTNYSLAIGPVIQNFYDGEFDLPYLLPKLGRVMHTGL